MIYLMLIGITIAQHAAIMCKICHALDALFALADFGAGPECARRPGGVKGI